MSVEQFDLCGELPSGVTVLEASAGTGKTYTIATLAARYVAAGVPLRDLLLITFTRMATGELRDRVRERLTGVEGRLSRILAGASDDGADPVLTLLATGETGEVLARRDRLARAVADFDAATITTTHGFCQEVLAELGTVGDLEPGTTFVEDVSDLLGETLDDLYVRRFHRRGGAPFDRPQALAIARAAVANPLAELEPRDARRETTAAMRYRLAVAARDELERRKRQLAVLTYDDLLTRLIATLDGPNGEMARERLRSRYRVVLVDEFQDTDPYQWQILWRAFGSPSDGVTLVLIADPKQAIYAFRGADVYAYLYAASTARTRATLHVNRRSDQPLLDAYDALFGDARLGHPGIVYRNINAAAAHGTSRLVGTGSQAALRVRVVHRDEPTIERTPYGYARAPSAREHVAKDLAADVVALLRSGARIERRAADGSVVEQAAIQPGDIAVLVRTHNNADLVRRELVAARVPAVINGAGSVFAVPAARDWLRLLEAVERPASALRARTAALTAFLGWDAERVASASEQDWEDVHRRLHRWGRILRDSGVAALAEAITVGEGLPSRLLRRRDGERLLTDLRHLAQLLHGAASAERLGATALRGWLAQRIGAAGREEDDERTRRLESDADAVQVLTIHRSKGLEFPVVYCPFLWEPSYIPRDPEPVFFHDPAKGDLRTIDVGLDSPGFSGHVRQHRVEQRGEDLRLAYVALTRAMHRAVVWWAPSSDSRHGPLTRLLFSQDAKGNVAPDGGSTPTDAAADVRFAELAAAAPGRIAIERSTLGELPASWSPPVEEVVDLSAASFDRRLDQAWRRTSYTDITEQAHEPLVASEPEEPIVSDEPQMPAAIPEPGPRDGLAVEGLSLFGELPVGASFGTFVHRLLEATDFAAADLDSELAQRLADGASRRALELGAPAQVVMALQAAIETPLELAGVGSLREIERGDRLDELQFELPLVGGDDPSGRLTLTAIAQALEAHLEADDPLLPYAARLHDPALRATLRGFLTGSIDLVLRLPGPRFAIVDYKTNWLGPAGEPLALRHYLPEALAQEMTRAHYGLQALLYAVALHRYLRWRLPGYDPASHVAGVMYLFLRGMAGADTPAGCGIFTWRPRGELIAALSDVLDRGTAAG